IEPSFAAATHAGWWVIAGLGVISLALGVVTTTEWAKQTARRTAERFRESVGRKPTAGTSSPQAELIRG
ncbi:MAG: hypothetical protein WAN22_14560, partial [Solirubrobacteraceae bacterium]